MGSQRSQVSSLISGARLWLLRLASLLAFPVLTLALLEGGLRLAGYGANTSFWIPAARVGQLQTNARFGWRFFAPTMNQFPTPIVIDRERKPDSVRIVVFGGSAANGWPTPLFAFSRILEVMLRESFPATRFEVVNAGMTAINSHVVLPIVHDSEVLSADLYIVYLGNNEVVGPFGAGSVIQGYQPSLHLIRANLALRAMRTGQLLSDIASRLRRGGEAPTIWRGMEMFVEHEVPANDPRLAIIEDHLRTNLLDIVEASRQAGADLVLATPLTNLRNLPPFASSESADLTRPQMLERRERTYRAHRLLGEDRHEDAVPLFEAAIELDPGHAASHFGLATALLAAGDFEGARDHFIRARDLDALRFRADSRVIETIREVARSTHTPLVDIEAIVAVGHPSGIVGEELLLEHVHLTFEGNYAIAAALFAAVVDALTGGGAIALAPLTPATPLAPAQCADLLGVSDELIYSEGREALNSIAARPPFDASWQSEAIEHWDARHHRFGPADPNATLEKLSNVLANQGDDLLLREIRARRLERDGLASEAIRDLQAILERYPDWEWILSRLANLELRQGQSEAAIDHARSAVALNPGAVAAWSTLSAALASQDEFPSAIRALEQAIRLTPEVASLHATLGRLLVASQRLEEAGAAFRVAALRAPREASYLHELARVEWALEARGKALQTIRQAAKLAPASVEIHIEAARFAAKQQRFGLARHHQALAVALDPAATDRLPELGHLPPLPSPTSATPPTREEARP